MNQRGITTVVFIIGILTLSIGIIGSRLYFKNKILPVTDSSRIAQQGSVSQAQPTTTINQTTQPGDIYTPEEGKKRQRDAFRLTDLANLQSAIEVVIQIANNNKVAPSLCQTNPPCKGSSNDPSPNVKVIDGTGWVKVDLGIISRNNIGMVVPKTLPIDPTNDQTYHYTYATNSKGTAWEIEAIMESDQMKTRNNAPNKSNYTLKDGIYKVGTDLTLLP